MKTSLWLGVVGFAAGCLLTTDAAQSAIATRTYTAGRYALDIGGIHAGWLVSVSDTATKADAVEVASGVGRFAQKAGGNVAYGAIALKVGTGMSKGFYEWLKSSVAHIHARRDGAIIGTDYGRSSTRSSPRSPSPPWTPRAKIRRR